MAKNIFISFRYSDGHIYKEELDEIFEDSNFVINYSEDEDRSEMSEETIKKYLYSKLKETSVTILIVTPESLNHIKNDSDKYDDWIYDELRYSLEDREDNRTNGLIAVYVPEVKGDLITEVEHECNICNNKSIVNRIKDVDNIFRKNMMNIKEEYKYNKCEGIYDSNLDSYCSLIPWDDFKKNYTDYIEKAAEKRERKEEFNIIKRM